MLPHFGVTSSLASRGRGDELTDADRIVWKLEDGWIAYRSQHKLGGVWLARDDREREEITGPPGPDAATLRERLTGRGGGTKVLLRAGMHPRRQVAELGDDDVDRLTTALSETIESSLPAGRIPASDGWLNAVRGNDEAACPRCGAPLASGTVAGRTAWWCTAEQSEPGG